MLNVKRKLKESSTNSRQPAVPGLKVPFLLTIQLFLDHSFISPACQHSSAAPPSVPGLLAARLISHVSLQTPDNARSVRPRRAHDSELHVAKPINMLTKASLAASLAAGSVRPPRPYKGVARPG